jgi:hypothetical protein
MHWLPNEVLCLIFLFLEPSRLGCVALVCSHWANLLSSNPIFWRELMKLHFPWVNRNKYEGRERKVFKEMWKEISLKFPTKKDSVKRGLDLFDK